MSNEELKAVVQEAIEADLFDNSFKSCSDRDYCLFDCGRCQCFNTNLAPEYCPECIKIEVDTFHSEELDGQLTVDDIF